MSSHTSASLHDDVEQLLGRTETLLKIPSPRSPSGGLVSRSLGSGLPTLSRSLSRQATSPRNATSGTTAASLGAVLLRSSSERHSAEPKHTMFARNLMLSTSPRMAASVASGSSRFASSPTEYKHHVAASIADTMAELERSVSMQGRGEAEVVTGRTYHSFGQLESTVDELVSGRASPTGSVRSRSPASPLTRPRAPALSAILRSSASFRTSLPGNSSSPPGSPPPRAMTPGVGRKSQLQAMLRKGYVGGSDLQRAKESLSCAIDAPPALASLHGHVEELGGKLKRVLEGWDTLEGTARETFQTLFEAGLADIFARAVPIWPPTSGTGTSAAARAPTASLLPSTSQTAAVVPSAVPIAMTDHSRLTAPVAPDIPQRVAQLQQPSLSPSAQDPTPQPVMGPAVLPNMSAGAHHPLAQPSSAYPTSQSYAPPQPPLAYLGHPVSHPHPAHASFQHQPPQPSHTLSNMYVPSLHGSAPSSPYAGPAQMSSLAALQQQYASPLPAPATTPLTPVSATAVHSRQRHVLQPLQQPYYADGAHTPPVPVPANTQLASLHPAPPPVQFRPTHASTATGQAPAYRPPPPPSALTYIAPAYSARPAPAAAQGGRYSPTRSSYGLLQDESAQHAADVYGMQWPYPSSEHSATPPSLSRLLHANAQHEWLDSPS